MKDNFDDILKNKWEQFHFPVDEKHRQDMITLLDNQKRRRTGLIWWWTGLAGIAVAVFILLFLQQGSQLNNTDIATQPSPVTSKQETISTTTQAIQPENPGVEDAENIEASVQDNAKRSTSSSSSSSSSTTTTTTTVLSSSSLLPSPSPSASSNKQKMKQGKQGAKAQNNNAARNKISDKAFAVNEKNLKPDDLPIREGTFIVPALPLDSNLTVFTDQQNTVNSIEQIQVEQRDEHITSYLPILDIRNLEYTSSHDVKAEPVVIRRHPVRIFAEAGAGLVFASKPDFTSGWTFNIGGGLDYSLNNRTHLVFSGGYLLQNGGFDFERSSTVNQLSFGARSSFHTLTPEKLHFIYAKAGLHYHIQRHVISVLGGMQYLYGAQGDIAIQVVDDFNGTINDTDPNVWLKLDGMQQYLINAEIQYGYQITPKLSLHGGIRYYFTGIEAKDPELASRGFYWNGKYSRISPFFTFNYQLYGTR